MERGTNQLGTNRELCHPSSGPHLSGCQLGGQMTTSSQSPPPQGKPSPRKAVAAPSLSAASKAAMELAGRGATPIPRHPRPVDG